jgi:hypothetical protein
MSCARPVPDGVSKVALPQENKPPAVLSWDGVSGLTGILNDAVRGEIANALPFGWVDSEEEDDGARELPRRRRQEIAVLVQAAYVVESEVESLRDVMKKRGMPVRNWILLRTDESGDTKALYLIKALTINEAWYLVICHACDKHNARGVGTIGGDPLPDDYAIDPVALAKQLLEPSGRLSDVMSNFFSIAVGDYHIAPIADMSIPAAPVRK